MILHWLGDFAYVLIVGSYLVKDMLWLRSMAVLASVSMVTFNYFVPPFPMWVAIRWNTVMLTINIVQITLLVREKRAAVLTEEERELYETVFANLSLVEFKRLMRIAVRREIEGSTVIVREGEPVEALTLLELGTARVQKQGKEIAVLRAGGFIGEMSFITRKAASATVTSDGPVRVVQWPKAELGPMLVKNPSVRISLQALLGSDMAKKLEQ